MCTILISLRQSTWRMPGRLSLTIFSILLGASLSFNAAGASAEAKGKSGIRHVPMRSAELPPPGSPILLIFDLPPGERVIARERLLVVRDGRLLDATLIEGAAPDRDTLSHNVEINSPLVELKYQAIITYTDGEVLTSPQYTLRRPCVPNITLSSIDDPGDSSVQERLKRYVQQSRDLERDLSQYENAIELLESLVGKMKEGA